jgi:hypothetical protein
MEGTMTRASPELQAFYRAAQKQEEPKRADRRAVRATLLSAGAFSIAANAGAASGTFAALIPGGAKALVVGYVALGAAIGAGAAVVGVSSTRTPAALASASTASVARSHTISRSAPESSPAIAAEESSEAALPSAAPATTEPTHPSSQQRLLAPPPVPPSETASPSSLQRVIAPTPVPQSAPSLPEESRGLAEVQAALSAHDARKALQLLSIQDREYAAGALAQERSAARVVALCAAGLTSDAQAARAAFLFKYPQSPLSKRVSAACEK